MIENNKEKVLIYTSIIVIVIIIIGLIVLIWKPMIDGVRYSDINKYDTSVSYEEMMKEYYTKYLNNALNITNFDTLFNNIDSSYLDSIQISDKAKVKEYLKDNGLISTNINVLSVDYSTDGNVGIYRVMYTSHSKTRYVNLKETAPYKFTISFEQSDLSKISTKSNINVTKDNIKYNFKLVTTTDKSVNYKVTIENNSMTDYEFDFSLLNSFQLIYGDEKYVNMASVANSSTVDYLITPGSSKSIEVLFNIPFKNQLEINGFMFNNVKVDNSTQSIKIEF